MCFFQNEFQELQFETHLLRNFQDQLSFHSYPTHQFLLTPHSQTPEQSLDQPKPSSKNFLQLIMPKLGLKTKRYSRAEFLQILRKTPKSHRAGLRERLERQGVSWIVTSKCRVQLKKRYLAELKILLGQMELVQMQRK